MEDEVHRTSTFTAPLRVTVLADKPDGCLTVGRADLQFHLRKLANVRALPDAMTAPVFRREGDRARSRTSRRVLHVEPRLDTETLGLLLDEVLRVLDPPLAIALPSAP